MNILILHRVRYDDMLYHEAIDHDIHNVVYVGTTAKLGEIPSEIRCTRIVRSDERQVHVEVLESIAEINLVFDHVISVNEFELMDAALIRQTLNIQGPSPEQVEKVRNKMIMKTQVSKAGIQYPTFAGFDQWIDNRATALSTEGPVILKPVDGASSEDVIKYDSISALSHAVDSLQTGIKDIDNNNTETFSRYQIEEFVVGPILHIDGFVRHGEIELVVVSKYINTLLDFANGIPCGSVQLDHSEETTQWVQTVLRAVDLNLGAFHLEAISSESGLVFLEVAHRVGGARISETLTHQIGMHPSCAEFGLIIDESYTLKPTLDLEHKYGWFIFPGHHLGSKHHQITGHEFLRDERRVIALNELETSSELPSEISYKEADLPLAGLIRADSSEEVEALIRRAFADVQLSPANES